MKIKTVALFLIVIFSTLSAFAGDRCIECRQAAVQQWKKCMASAKANTDMADCNVKGQKLGEACDNGEGICKVTFSDEDKKDMALVVDFVKNNMDVIRQVGNFQYAQWEASDKSLGGAKPSRHVVYVFGGATNTGGSINTHVVVDISRLSGDIQPTLACITNISPSQFRVPLKDICKQ